MKKLLIVLAFCFVGSFYAAEDKNKTNEFKFTVTDELIVGTNTKYIWVENENRSELTIKKRGEMSETYVFDNNGIYRGRKQRCQNTITWRSNYN